MPSFLFLTISIGKFLFIFVLNSSGILNSIARSSFYRLHLNKVQILYFQTIMNSRLQNYLQASQNCINTIPLEHVAQAARFIANHFKAGGTWFLAGNGGSASDAQHIAAEIVGRFVNDRPALPAIALPANSSNVTAIANDYGFDHVFSRQLEGLLKKNDIFMGISTSGNSKNIVNACKTAKSKECLSIGLTGHDGGALKDVVDCLICVPETVTSHIQEAHIVIGHLICQEIEVLCGYR